MDKKEKIPSYIRKLGKEDKKLFFDLYKNAKRPIDSLPTHHYTQALEATIELAARDFQKGEIPKTLHEFFIIIRLSELVGDLPAKITALCNLGILNQNLHKYDVAEVFATEGYELANKNKLIELKLQALKVKSLIATNTSQSEKLIVIQKEIAQIYRNMGQNEKATAMEKQLNGFRSFLDLLGKNKK